MKHNGSPAISDSVLEMRWSAIQGNWHGLIMNLGGILDYPSEGSEYTRHSVTEPIQVENSTTVMEELHARLDVQDEMIDRCRRSIHRNKDDMNEHIDNQNNMIDYCVRSVDNIEYEVKELRKEFETPEPKNTVHIPDSPEKALRCIPYCCTRGGKRQRLSDRFTDLEHNLEVEISGSEEEEEQEEEDEEEEEQEDEEEDEEEDTEDYLELRSGAKYYK